MLVDEEGGAVVTLLNWAGKQIPRLMLNISNLGFTPSKVESVVHGPISTGGMHKTLTLSVPLESADFLLFHK